MIEARRFFMKTCDACGYENDDDADFCARCGAHLADKTIKPQKHKENEECYGSEEDECFGLPYGGAICGLIFGVFIILWAIGVILGWSIWDYFLPIILVTFGVLLVAGAIYTMRQRR
jgi:uncharacterized integral membrane protein